MTPFLISLTQQILLFAIGGFLFGLHVEGSVLAIGLVAFAQALALVALGVLITAVLRSIQQVGAISNVMTILAAGLAGALVPFAALPTVVQKIAPVAPSYWAMQGYEAVILGKPFVEVLLPIAVLVGFAVVFSTIAVRCWRTDDVKVDWT